MKKVLLVFDGPNFSENTLKFARQMNETEPMTVTGVFLPQYDYSAALAYSAGSIAIPVFDMPTFEEDTPIFEANKVRFSTWCINNGIEYNVHKDFGDFAMDELEKETIFADLLIISSELFYRNSEYAYLNSYLKDILHFAKCPVVVVPNKYTFPTINTLAYDGSESSVYAIKQFAYLFPALTANKTFLVYAHEDKEKEIPDEPYIEELAVKHFPDLTVVKLNFESKDYLSFWASDKKAAIVISGAFGRSGVSRLFKKSFINTILKDHKTPVFIAHR